jgi:hypothetical protein
MSLILLSFFKSECSAIRAFVEETCQDEKRDNSEDSEINEFVITFDEVTATKLREYLKGIDDETEATEAWNRSARIAIIHHLQGFEINFPLLIKIVESHEFDLELDDHVEIIRMYDILGAEKRLREYEILLYEKIIERDERFTWRESNYGKRLPVCFESHIYEMRQIGDTMWNILHIGSKPLLIYKLQRGNITPQWKNLLFNRLCTTGKLEVLIWFHELIQFDLKLIVIIDSFRQSCINGHLEVVQWLYNFYCKDYTYHQQFHVYLGEIFRCVCTSGKLQVAQWLYTLDNTLDIHAYDDLAFRNACRNGHFEIMHWLYGLGGIPIHGWNSCAFISACRFGDIALAQKLYHLPIEVSGKNVLINIHADDEAAFQSACAAGDLKLAQWLYSLGEVNIHVNNDIVFQLASMYYQTDVLEWLQRLE